VLLAPDRRAQALAALAPAGAAALAVTQTLGLPEAAALSVTAVSAAGAAALPYLDRPRGHLEEAYPPSYAPKLLGLAGAAAAPAAAALVAPVLPGDAFSGLAAAVLIQGGTAAALAALTTGQEYALQIETFRSLNLDWALPLAAVALRQGRGPVRWAALAALAAGWAAARARTPDALGRLDKDLPAGHTHHLSAAQRLLGDALISLGPRPGRKWAGLGLAGLPAAALLRRFGKDELALGAALAATAANAVMLAAFRQAERPLALTARGVGRSWAGWAVVAAGLIGTAELVLKPHWT
jgi:hypothetical protein